MVDRIGILDALLRTEIALSDLMRKDSCILLLHSDGLHICADVYYKSTCIASQQALTIWEAMDKATAELFPTPPGTLDAKLETILLGELVDEN